MRLGIFHDPQLRDALSRATSTKGAKELIVFRNLRDLSDRGVRFGIFHDPQLRDALLRATAAKGAKELIVLETLETLATVA